MRIPTTGGIANAKNNNNDPVGNIAIAAAGTFFGSFFVQAKKEQTSTKTNPRPHNSNFPKEHYRFIATNLIPIPYLRPPYALPKGT
jgi:hypothetical protein